MRKILNTITKIFGSLAALLLLVVIVVVVLPLVPPFRNYLHTRTVLTGSMAKAVPTGALIINHYSKDRDLKVGDIITFQRPGTSPVIFVTHRIFSIDKSGALYRFQTKGDANQIPDNGKISQASIEGKVITVVPHLGYLIELLKNPVVFAVLVFLPLSLFIIRQLRDAWKIWKDMSSEKERKNSSNLGQKGAITVTLFLFLQAIFLQRIYASFLSSAVHITAIKLASIAITPSPSPSPATTPVSTPISTPTPTPIPTPVSTIAPSSTPSPSPTPSPVSNCGGSQSNNTNVSTTVSSSTDSGGNVISNNTGSGSATINSGNSSSSANIFVSGSNNNCNLQ